MYFRQNVAYGPGKINGGQTLAMSFQRGKHL